MSHEYKDKDWMEFADELRKLNLDFYWRLRNRMAEEYSHKAKPPARPAARGGIGISMSQRQEHSSPFLTEDSVPELPPKPGTGGRKRNLPERGL